MHLCKQPTYNVHLVNSFFAVIYIEFLGFTLVLYKDTASKYFIQYKVPGGTIDLSVKVTQILLHDIVQH